MSLYLLGYIVGIVLTVEYVCVLFSSGFADQYGDPEQVAAIRQYPTAISILFFCFAVVWPIYWLIVLMKLFKKD